MLLGTRTRRRVKFAPIQRTQVLSKPFIFSDAKSLTAAPQASCNCTFITQNCRAQVLCFSQISLNSSVLLAQCGYCLHSCHIRTFSMHKTILLRFRCIKSYLHVTDKQAEPCWLLPPPPPLTLEEVSAGSLPLNQKENHPSSAQPMAADLRPSP